MNLGHNQSALVDALQHETRIAQAQGMGREEARTKAVEALCERYKLKAKPHPKYPNLFQFKYNQIESPFDEAIVREARGIILDSDFDWWPVARPFDKFFNHGEALAASIDWVTARVQEKLDGSLMILYWYDGRWHVASSGTPDAGGVVNGFDFTFAELFWKTWAIQGLSIGWKLDPDMTYMFELTSPYNRVVVQHDRASLTLIGVRRNSDGQEFEVEPLSGRFPVVKEFQIHDLEGIARTFPAMEPTSQEGYVVVDCNFHRIKVKNPAYVALHNARDGFGMRRMVEIARGGEQGEWLAYFPEFKDDFEKVKQRLDMLVVILESQYDRHKHIDDQKEFALAVKDLPCSGALFALRRGKVGSVREFLANMNIRNLMELLAVEDKALSQEVA